MRALILVSTCVLAASQDLFLKSKLDLPTAPTEDLKRARPPMGLAGVTEKVIDFSSKDEHFRKMNAHRIPCPMIASFYRKGWLNPDRYGSVESSEVYNCLRKSGASAVNSLFYAWGIVSYNATDYEQTQRSRDYGNFLVTCGNPFISKRRYVNIFRMNPGDYINSQHVQHGFSTTIRDGRYDDMARPVRVKEGEGLVVTEGREAEDEQQEYDRVRKLRQERFDEWIGAEGVLDKQGRMYATGLGKLLVDMKDHGDRSGEFSFDPKSSEKQNIDKWHPKASEKNGDEVKEPLSEWQAILAWMFTLLGFGQDLNTGQGGEYLTRDDLVSLFLDSELPKNYTYVDYGFEPSDMNVLIEFEEEQPALKLPPQVKDKNYYRSIHLAPSVRIGVMQYLDTLRRLGMFIDDQNYQPPP